jgi:SAM-dependent methyltransferase
MNGNDLDLRLKNEAEHGAVILQQAESNWGWHTPAGKVRWQRRIDFLSDSSRAKFTDPHVLEIGCGTGSFTKELSKAYGHLTAIDISPALLARAKQKCPSVIFELRDAHNTNFADCSFDIVVGCSVLHHLDWDKALNEFYRILKVGGLLIFSEPNLRNPQIFLQKNWGWLKRRSGDSPDEYAFNSGQIRTSLEQSGYADITVEPYEFLHPMVPKVLIPIVQKIEKVLELTPLVQFAGSLKISAFRKTKSLKS